MLMFPLLFGLRILNRRVVKTSQENIILASDLLTTANIVKNHIQVFNELKEEHQKLKLAYEAHLKEPKKE
jgi:hypothetical protein